MRQPTAQPPPVRRRPSPAAGEPAPSPDDVVCPNCGAGNRPQRRFCRRCSAQLTASAAQGASSQPAAGARPRARNTRVPFTAILVMVIILGALVVAWLNRDDVIAWVQSIVGVVFSTEGG